MVSGLRAVSLGMLALAGASVFASAALAETVYIGCALRSEDGGRKVIAMTPLIVLDVGELDEQRLSDAWSDYLEANHRDKLKGKWLTVKCGHSTVLHESLDAAQRRRANEQPGAAIIDWRPSASEVSVGSGGKVTVGYSSKTTRADSEAEVAAKADEKRTGSADETEKARIVEREAREARWQDKLDAYESEKRAWEAKVAAQKAEEVRQQAEHAAAQEAAAREKAAYEAKMAAHRRELEEANRRQQAYFTAQRRHALCLNGDQAQCAALKDGDAGQLADAGDASTDSDANQCVTTVETKLNATFKGSTSASIINGCGKPVDVRICLMTDKGWNCGVVWAVASQAKAVHSSFHATGEVFVDAKITGSKKALNSPR